VRPTSALVTFFLPLVALWAAATALVTLAALHLARAPRLPTELLGAVAASGGAAGGVLAVSTVATGLTPAAAGDALVRLLAAAGAGMLLGAVLAVGGVLLAVRLWTGGGE
jgi:hypothetical protein